MTGTNYAILDPIGKVMNVIVWDGESALDLPENQTVHVTPAPDGSDAQIGGAFTSGTFTAPTAATEPAIGPTLPEVVTTT